MNSEEIWKDIPGFEGRYQASNHGRVKALAWLVRSRKACRIGSVWYMRPKKERILSPSRGGHRRMYLFCGLSRPDGVTQQVYVHRLVAMAFHGPPPTTKHQVNHIDRDTTNNRPENLHWVTGTENMRHPPTLDASRGASKRRGLKFRGSNNPNAKLSDADVAEIIRLATTTEKTYQQIGNIFGVTYSWVYEILARRGIRRIRESKTRPRIKGLSKNVHP